MAAEFIEIYYSTDKNGRTRAYRFSRRQFRSFPMSRQDADAAILEGRAVILDGNPLKPVSAVKAETIDYRARKWELEQAYKAVDAHTARLDRSTDPVAMQAHKDAIATAERVRNDLAPVVLDMARKLGKDFVAIDAGAYCVNYEWTGCRWEAFVSFV